MKMRTALTGAFAVLCLTASVGSASAQNTPPAPRDTTAALRVFIDCSYMCDMDFIRTEMPWVDYMQDRADAQVHVLITSQGTGGGGSQYMLNFIGLRQFAAMNDTLLYTSSSNDSQDATRRGLTKMIQLGLVPFIARTPLGRRMNITVASPTGGAEAKPSAPKDDPWHAWVFRLSMNGNKSGESKSKNNRVSGSASASRTTEQWKSSLSFNTSESKQEFTYPDTDSTEQTNTFTTESRSAYGSLVKSLGANFSAGITGSLSKSSFGNTKLSATIAPAVEYDFFPYKESSRRMLTAQYSVGIRSYQYRDTTIYFKIEETHPHHALNLSYYTQEQWGSVNLSANYSEFLHDRKFYNAGIFGSTDVRLFKGFSFNVFADYSKVHDQLSLSGAGLTTEDVLLRQRELATDYRYSVYFGLSYRFGSIFNNVVNPRMGGGGGGSIIFF